MSSVMAKASWTYMMDTGPDRIGQSVSRHYKESVGQSVAMSLAMSTVLQLGYVGELALVDEVLCDDDIDRAPARSE